MSETLRVSVSTVRRAISSGKLESYRVGERGQLRVTPEAINEYLGMVPALPYGPDSGDGLVAEPEPPTPTASQALKVFEGESSRGHNWKLINADVIDGLRVIESGSVNCIVTSPPYFWQRDYGFDGQVGHEPTVKGFADSMARVFSEAKRTLAADGLLFLNLGDTYYSAKGKPHGTDLKHKGRQMSRQQLRAVDGPGLGLPRKSLIGIPWRSAIALQDDGWTLRSNVIWQRPAPMPEPTAKDRPWRSFEHIFVFSKGPKYWFDRSGLGGDEDIWSVTARPYNPGSHFAPYPEELVERCLSCGCRPGGTVLDPFVGSGTTMAVGLRKGHHVIGIDKSEKYCGFVLDRINAGAKSPREASGSLF